MAALVALAVDATAGRPPVPGRREGPLVGAVTAVVLAALDTETIGVTTESPVTPAPRPTPGPMPVVVAVDAAPLDVDMVVGGRPTVVLAVALPIVGT